MIRVIEFGRLSNTVYFTDAANHENANKRRHSEISKKPKYIEEDSDEDVIEDDEDDDDDEDSDHKCELCKKKVNLSPAVIYGLVKGLATLFL